MEKNSGSVTERGWAKINLALNITGRRSGYHTLESVIMRAPLFYEVTIRFSDADSVVYSDGAEYPRDNVIGALNAVRKFFASDKRFAVEVKRNIPGGKGLGASSAAAAAATVGAAKLLGNGDPKILSAVLSEAGADCAFQASGADCALATGLGEKLVPMEFPKLYTAFCSTSDEADSGKVYEVYDITGGAGGSIEKFKEDLLPFNSLEVAAVALKPDILSARRALTDAGYERVVMTGSGAGYIGFTADEESHRKNYSALIKIAAERGLNIYDFTEVENER